MMRSQMLQKIRNAALTGALVLGMAAGASTGQAQTRKNIFQPGEQLVYKVKYGFVKLGTVVIQTGNIGADGKMAAKLQFWTADVPFLNAKSTVTDMIDTRDITVSTFKEVSVDGDKTKTKQFVYNRDAKTVTYSDEETKDLVTTGVNPFWDALSLVYSMRAWSGAAGKKYVFQMRGAKGANKPVTVNFTNNFSNEEVPALDDKEVRTRVLEGQADMGESSPLGANGGFTAYVSDDEAAIPVRIDMKIAVGSISLVLDKVKRRDWTAAK